jgi:hypothetical protein
VLGRRCPESQMNTSAAVKRGRRCRVAIGQRECLVVRAPSGLLIDSDDLATNTVKRGVTGTWCDSDAARPGATCGAVHPAGTVNVVVATFAPF